MKRKHWLVQMLLGRRTHKSRSLKRTIWLVPLLVLVSFSVLFWQMDMLPLPGYQAKYEIARQTESRGNLMRIFEATRTYELRFHATPGDLNDLCSNDLIVREATICPTSKALGLSDPSHIFTPSDHSQVVVTEPDFRAALSKLSLGNFQRHRLAINREGKLVQMTD